MYSKHKRPDGGFPLWGAPAHQEGTKRSPKAAQWIPNCTKNNPRIQPMIIGHIPVPPCPIKCSRLTNKDTKRTPRAHENEPKGSPKEPKLHQIAKREQRIKPYSLMRCSNHAKEAPKTHKGHRKGTKRSPEAPKWQATESGHCSREHFLRKINKSRAINFSITNNQLF